MSSHKAGVASLWKVCKVVLSIHGSAQHAVLVIATATHHQIWIGGGPKVELRSRVLA